MRIFKWLFLLALWSLIAGFFWYQLPRTDIVRIVNTEIRRTDVGQRPMFWAESDAGTNTLETRDVRFIEAVRENGRPAVYRNEDTGWGWPPYFKFDSSNLQAEAADLASTREDPRWVAIKRYGWRVPMISIYPNALSVRPVSGPDALVIPWVAIVVLVVFFALFWAIYVRWRRFRTARIDPTLDAADTAWAERRERAAERRRLKRQQRDGI